MKITIELSGTTLDSFVAYQQLTGVSVNTQIDEALADYVACVIPARIESIQKKPTLIGCSNLYVM
jgi:hypothetical protein